MRNKPIGVFDSGVGGLTVLAELMRLLPHEDIVYFGDMGRTPYGPRSKDIILEFTRQDVNFLMEQDVKFVVAACNTAAAVALGTVSSEHSIDMLGVIEPGARAAVATTKNNKIGIIGTNATIASNAYPKAIQKINKDIKVFSLACPLFVPLAEEGYSDKEATRLIAEDYFKPLKDNHIDTLVLGCTHYPLLKNTIQKVIGKDVTIIDSATSTAIEVEHILNENNLTNEQSEAALYKFYVSDVPDKFAPVAERFLGHRIDNIIRVDITKY
ncbi:MAG: glutamate racemase [candidate division Zixibacteria bacterium]|nr:glutamate racemase [candidate division Zixibacteria bacterium]